MWFVHKITWTGVQIAILLKVVLQRHSRRCLLISSARNALPSWLRVRKQSIATVVITRYTVVHKRGRLVEGRLGITRDGWLLWDSRQQDRVWWTWGRIETGGECRWWAIKLTRGVQKTGEIAMYQIKSKGNERGTSTRVLIRNSKKIKPVDEQNCKRLSENRNSRESQSPQNPWKMNRVVEPPSPPSALQPWRRVSVTGFCVYCAYLCVYVSYLSLDRHL